MDGFRIACDERIPFVADLNERGTLTGNKSSTRIWLIHMSRPQLHPPRPFRLRICVEGIWWDLMERTITETRSFVQGFRRNIRHPSVNPLAGLSSHSGRPLQGHESADDHQIDCLCGQ